MAYLKFLLLVSFPFIFSCCKSFSEQTSSNKSLFQNKKIKQYDFFDAKLLKPIHSANGEVYLCIYNSSGNARIDFSNETHRKTIISRAKLTPMSDFEVGTKRLNFKEQVPIRLDEFVAASLKAISHKESEGFLELSTLFDTTEPREVINMTKRESKSLASAQKINLFAPLFTSALAVLVLFSPVVESKARRDFTSLLFSTASIYGLIFNRKQKSKIDNMTSFIEKTKFNEKLLRPILDKNYYQEIKQNRSHYDDDVLKFSASTRRQEFRKLLEEISNNKLIENNLFLELREVLSKEDQGQVSLKEDSHGLNIKVIEYLGHLFYKNFQPNSSDLDRPKKCPKTFM